MTDNEKAATFIGWKPDCRGCEKSWEHLDYFNGRKSNEIRHHDAPDMSRPDNYMKALEAVRDKGYVWALGGQPEWLVQASRDRHPDGRGDERIHTVAFWGYRHENLAKEAYGNSDDGNAAKAIGKALAALYDAEHPKDKP